MVGAVGAGLEYPGDLLQGSSVDELALSLASPAYIFAEADLGWKLFEA
jgi:hypothetical protein